MSLFKPESGYCVEVVVETREMLYIPFGNDVSLPQARVLSSAWFEFLTVMAVERNDLWKATLVMLLQNYYRSRIICCFRLQGTKISLLIYL
jgi:hypothetical protein